MDHSPENPAAKFDSSRPALMNMDNRAELLLLVMKPVMI